MSARDELQQWADDACHTLAVYVDGKCYYSIDLDLVRRVLAELDAAHTSLGVA